MADLARRPAPRPATMANPSPQPLAGRFAPTGPKQVCVSVDLDPCSRRLVCWSTGNLPVTSAVLTALRPAGCPRAPWPTCEGGGADLEAIAGGAKTGIHGTGTVDRSERA